MRSFIVNNLLTKQFLTVHLCTAGVRIQRTGKMVVDKIGHIEGQMRAAIDWSESATGAGLQDGDEGTWKDSIKKYCKYYFELIDVVKDRAAFVPPVTTDDPNWENAGKNQECTEGDIEYYWQCNCGEDRAACGACGNGWARRQLHAVESGIGAFTPDNKFYLVGGDELADEFLGESGSGSGSGIPADNASKKHSSSSGDGSGPTRKKPRRPKSPKENTSTDSLLLKIMTRRLEYQDEKREALKQAADDDVSKKVKLAKQFNEMTSSLGGNKIMAAKVCPEFQIFLSSKEKRELRSIVEEEQGAQGV